MQEPLLRDIIRLAFDNVQAYLMFRNAFPDADLELSFIKDSILAAARAHRPDAGPICERLDDDRFYMSQIIPLVSCCITLTITILKMDHSHVRGSSFSETRSKSAAESSSQRRYQQ